jgi:hypothetical protein
MAVHQHSWLLRLAALLAVGGLWLGAPAAACARSGPDQELAFAGSGSSRYGGGGFGRSYRSYSRPSYRYGYRRPGYGRGFFHGLFTGWFFSHFFGYGFGFGFPLWPLVLMLLFLWLSRRRRTLR